MYDAVQSLSDRSRRKRVHRAGRCTLFRQEQTKKSAPTGALLVIAHDEIPSAYWWNIFATIVHLPSIFTSE